MEYQRRQRQKVAQALSLERSDQQQGRIANFWFVRVAVASPTLCPCANSRTSVKSFIRKRQRQYLIATSAQFAMRSVK
eukprot:12398626-Karenia_brevis.AAC.1